MITIDLVRLATDNDAKAKLATFIADSLNLPHRLLPTRWINKFISFGVNSITQAAQAFYLYPQLDEFSGVSILNFDGGDPFFFGDHEMLFSIDAGATGVLGNYQLTVAYVPKDGSTPVAFFATDTISTLEKRAVYSLTFPSIPLTEIWLEVVSTGVGNSISVAGAMNFNTLFFSGL